MNDLLIIGGGAAGLFAAVQAGEAGLSALLLERRHRPGLKLLMCGNNRCNISHAYSPQQMAGAYGTEIAPFLRQAIDRLSPDALRRWFAKHGLQTAIHGERIYPKSENADDVLHCFTDALRELGVPMALNCPVQKIVPLPHGGYQVLTENHLQLEAANILLCTGGVSYPKTGSVGDGQRMAEALGLRVTPLRPGLAGLDHKIRWLTTRENSDLPNVQLTVYQQGKAILHTRGNLLCAGSVLRGTAVFDAVRLLSHRNVSDHFEVELSLVPDIPDKKLTTLFAKGYQDPALVRHLEDLSLPAQNATALADAIRRNAVQNIPALLKAIPVPVLGIRPLKEAIVTVGGVARDQVNPATMESTKYPGLFFAGELLDVDGPTGGFNLHAAFATANLAISAIAAKVKNLCKSHHP